MENNILDSGVFNSPSMSFHERVAQIQNEGFDFSIGDCLSEAFEIFKQNIFGFIGFLLILMAINITPTFFGFAAGETGGMTSSLFSLIATFISIPLGVGPAIVAKKIKYNEPYSFNNFFGGFNYFGNLLIAGILMMFAILFGFIFFIIPSIYLAIAFGWTNFMVVFPELSSVDALSTSRKVIHKNWIKMLLFGFVLGLVVLAGFIAFGIGVLVAIPVASIAQFVAYDKVMDSNLK